MSDSIPDLWPSEYADATIRTPEEILNEQVSRLEARSKLLRARVESKTKDGMVVLEFLVSLADGRLTTRICSLYHPVDRCWPVQLHAEGLGHKIANTNRQFFSLIAEVLRNPLVCGGMESLLAAAAQTHQQPLPTSDGNSNNASHATPGERNSGGVGPSSPAAPRSADLDKTA